MGRIEIRRRVGCILMKASTRRPGLLTWKAGFRWETWGRCHRLGIMHRACLMGQDSCIHLTFNEEKGPGAGD